MEYGYSYNPKTPCDNLLVGCGLHGFTGSFDHGKSEHYTIVYKDSEYYTVAKGQYLELEGKNIASSDLFKIKREKVYGDSLGPISGDPSSTYHCVFNVKDLETFTSHPAAGSHKVVLTTDKSAIDALKANRGGFRRRKTRRTGRKTMRTKRRRSTRRRR
jgi:hypothetical protein